jgi:adenylate cyclase
MVRALFGAQLVAAAVILLHAFGWLQTAELAVYDALIVAWAGPAPSPRVVLVGVTERDVGRWGDPLRDGQLAALLERVAAWKPRVIGVDIYRDMPQAPGTDDLDRVLTGHPEILWVFKLGEGSTATTPPPAALVGTDRAVLADTLTDADDVVRRGLLYAGDDTGEAMGVALAYLARDGIRPGPAPGDAFTLGKAVVDPLDSTRGPYLHLDDRGYQVLLDYRGGRQPFPFVSMGEIMDRDDAAALVRDRAVIVGITAETVKDWFSTPFGGFGPENRAYGISIHAHLADQLIRQALDGDRQLSGASRPVEYAVIWAVAMAGAVFGYFWRFTIQALAGIGAGLVLLATLVYGAFGFALLLPGVPMALGWLGSSGLTNLMLHAATNRERSRLRRSFEHYLPAAIISEMVASRALPRIGGERREISVIFTDIANFTTLSETMDPEELAALLNQYFAGACGAVFGQGAYVYEFIGDAILAFFNAPHDQPDHADRAVDAALALDAFAFGFREAQLKQGRDFGITRVGVHTGVALVGNIGTPDRLKYTALGDMLNTGSRLEGLNKIIGTRVCVSGDTVHKSERHRFRRIGEFVVKGRHGAVSVFAPLSPESGTIDQLERYQAALDALDAGDPDAGELFAALHRDFPDDPCVAFHHRRLAGGEIGALIVMAEK